MTKEEEKTEQLDMGYAEMERFLKECGYTIGADGPSIKSMCAYGSYAEHCAQNHMEMTVDGFAKFNEAQAELAKQKNYAEGRDSALSARVFKFVCRTHDDKGNELLTPEKVEQVMDEKGKRFQRWAWVLHDKDPSERDDALPDELKEPHIHFVGEGKQAIKFSDIAEWFGIPQWLIKFVRIRKNQDGFLDCTEYLTHEDEKQQALGKHLYDDEEIHANFDFREELDAMHERIALFGKAGRSMSELDTIYAKVRNGDLTIRQARNKVPVDYNRKSTVRSNIAKAREVYLGEAKPPSLRMNYYITGEGGLGKTQISKYIAKHLENWGDLEDDEIYFVVGQDKRVPFEGYDGQPVLIWNEWRSMDFISGLNGGRSQFLDMMDTHPGKTTVNIKYSKVNLINKYNIIASAEPFTDFLDNIAGQYVDKRGVQHIAEDKGQAFRRFPMIMVLHVEDYDILFNKGFVDADSREFEQFVYYTSVRCNMQQIMAKLDGDAKEKKLLDVSRPLLACHEFLLSTQDDSRKVSDVEALPQNFNSFGSTFDRKKLEEEEAQRKEILRSIEEENRAQYLASDEYKEKQRKEEEEREKQRQKWEQEQREAREQKQAEERRKKYEKLKQCGGDLDRAFGNKKNATNSLQFGVGIPNGEELPF